MKILPTGLKAQLESGATTLCWCWRLTRFDGVKMGFTDHDRDLSFDSTIFEAASGFAATEISSSVGLSVDHLEAQGALQSDKLNDKDLASGLFDNASIEIFRVNWQDVSERLLMHAGSIGEVKRGTHSFSAEVRGLAHYLQQQQGRLLQYGCDVDLGDGHCKVDLSGSNYRGTGDISDLISVRTFTVSGLGDYASDWFSRGLLRWSSGENSGLSMEVKAHSISNGQVTVELWQAMANPLQVGDQFSLTAGCDKQFQTCKTKFGNQVNFRGFPHIPGNDFMVSYPNSDDSQNDGSSRA